MQQQTGLSTWVWVFKYWTLLYLILVSSAIMLSINNLSAYYWLVYLLIVPIVVIPSTYRNLVGGGCSLRFQICALVKGVAAGSLFLVLTGVADFLVWNTISQFFTWTPFSDARLLMSLYQILLISGMIGGIGARIMEVRGHTISNVPKLTPIIDEKS